MGAPSGNPNVKKAPEYRLSQSAEGGLRQTGPAAAKRPPPSRAEAPTSALRSRWKGSLRIFPSSRRLPEVDLFPVPTPSSGTRTARLAPVPRVSRVDFGLLKGIDRMRDILIENTERFANGCLPTTHCSGERAAWASPRWSRQRMRASTWTARPADRLKLIEIHREDIESLPALMDAAAGSDFHFIVFCDDLSFDGDDASYKSLKAVLEGGIEGRPDNVILYATSNRRHLLARDMIENERSTAINPGDAVEEKVSLSDRFGLWLGFHRCSQDEYLAMVKGYCAHFASRFQTGT